MGVRDLGTVVLRHAPSAITPRTIASFAGKAIAIDGNLLMTKFHHVPAPEWLVSRALPLALLERHKHVRAWYTFMRALQRQDIRPIVVFDGDARVPEKEKENIRRRVARELQRQRGQAEQTRGERLATLRSTWASLEETKADILEAYRETLNGVTRTLELSERDEDTLQSLVTLHEEALVDADNPLYTPNQKSVTKDEETFFRNIVLEADLVVEWDEGLGKLQERSDALGESHRKRALSVPKHAYAETMQLLDALGIPCVKPSVDEPHEAEALCSTLYSLGLVDFVVSEDTDVAVYGAPLICRFSTQQFPAKAKKNGKERTVREAMHVLDPATLQKELGMTPEMFVDFSLMLGTDFTERIPLVGPMKALKLIRAHGTIEAVLEHGELKRLPSDPDAYLASVRAARKLFRTLPPLPPTASLSPQAESLELSDLLRGWGIRATDVPLAFGPPFVLESADVVESEAVDDIEGIDKEMLGIDLEADEARERQLVDLADAEADRIA